MQPVPRGALPAGILRVLEKLILRQSGIGIAIEVLIESTVMMTTRHSDSPPIASEAATTSCNRDEATGAERPSKPAAPDDRLMAEFL